MPLASIKQLGDNETVKTIESWYNQVTCMARATRAWKDYLDKQWSAEFQDKMRGFKDIAVNRRKPALTAAEQSSEVESLLTVVCTSAGQYQSQIGGHFTQVALQHRQKALRLPEIGPPDDEEVQDTPTEAD